MPLLKKCPSCGRRFGVTLEAREVLASDLEQQTISRGVAVPGGPGRSDFPGHPALVEEKEVIEREELETRYRCSKCGHSWAEKSTLVRRA